jgi:hypothetical protein
VPLSTENCHVCQLFFGVCGHLQTVAALPNFFYLYYSDTDEDTDAAKDDNNDQVDEDEVFFGPVGHTEKCVAVAVNEVAKVNEKLRPLSPLTAAEMAELCREACTVASRIEIAAVATCPATGNEKESVIDDVSNFVVNTNSDVSNGPLDGLKNSLIAALPSAELPCDANGVVKFGAVGKQLPKLAKPVIRRGTGSSQIGSSLVRPAAKVLVSDYDHFGTKGCL